MNILLIGGTGFISSRLTRKLLDAGHWVTLLTRGKSENPFGDYENLTFAHGNRRDETLLKNLGDKMRFDVVYDMIAYHPKDSEQIVNIFSGKTGRLIHCSTISVYMISYDVQCPVTEDQWTRPVMEYFARNPFGMDYGINKRLCEEVLWKAHNENRLKVTMLRPSYVSGPLDFAMRDYFWIERIMDGNPLLVPGSGDIAFQNVYVEDVARAFFDLLNNENTIGQAYNVTAEEIFSLNDYIYALSKLLNKETELVHLDQKEFDRLSISSSANGDVFPYNVRRTAVFSLEKIKKDMNYHSTPFNEWMAKTIEWFVNEYKGHSIGYERRKEELELIKQLKNKNIYI